MFLKNHRQIFNDEFIGSYLKDYPIKTDSQRLKEVIKLIFHKNFQ